MFFKKKKVAVDHSASKHWDIIVDVWARKYDMHGIERYVVLLLCLLKFIFPAFWIRHFTRNAWYRTRNRWIESYVLLKVLILMFFLLYYPDTILGLIVGVYILLDIIQYLLWLIFLSSIYTKMPSIKRNFAHLAMNLFEVAWWFALIYLYTWSVGSAWVPITDWITALYFSFVTFATIWYWDISAISQTWKILIIAEILVSVLFITIIASSFVSRLDIKNED